jgi:hypothetical protein
VDGLVEAHAALQQQQGTDDSQQQQQQQQQTRTLTNSNLNKARVSTLPNGTSWWQ